MAEQLYTSIAALTDTPSGTADTTLADNGGSITSGATSFLIASVPDGLSTSQGFVARIGSELIHCASISTLTVTVASSGRGYDGSTAASHNDGDAVYIVWSGAAMADWMAGNPPTLTDINGGNWKVPYTDADGDVVELPLGADGTFLKSNGASSAPTFALPALPYILIRDEKSSGTAGGTFTAGAWRTRDLTTEVVDTHSLASLGSNQITLAAGTYRIQATAPAHNSQQNRLRLQDITNTATLLEGQSMYAGAGGADGDDTANLVGRFTLAGSTVLEIQHYCANTKAGDGFGVTGSQGTVEIYTVVELWKVA